jgi:hypothetical protein
LRSCVPSLFHTHSSGPSSSWSTHRPGDDIPRAAARGDEPASSTHAVTPFSADRVMGDKGRAAG